MPPVGDVTLRERMDMRARDDPNRAFLIFEDRAYTFREIDEAVNRFANGLLARGLVPGDRVALMLPSHPDHIIAILALAKVGLVRVSVNVHLIGAALEHFFAQFEPHALVVDAAYEAPIAPILASGKVREIVWRGERARAGDQFSELAAYPDNRPPKFAPAADDIIALTPSSGTTGPPKGVLKSDRTLRAGPMGTLRLTGAAPGDVFFLWESLHHGAGVAVLIAAVLEKITLAMVDRFSASQFWDAVRHHRATHIHYLGGVLPMLLKQPQRADDREHAVRIAWGGGCPLEIWNAFSNRFGVQMREGYGLSEMITFVTINIDGPVGSIGKPLSYFDVRLVDDGGDEVATGVAGELLVRARTGPAFSRLFPQRGGHARSNARRLVSHRRSRQERRGRLALLCRAQDRQRAPPRHQHLCVGGRARRQRSRGDRGMRAGRRAGRIGRRRIETDRAAGAGQTTRPRGVSTLVRAAAALFSDSALSRNHSGISEDPDAARPQESACALGGKRDRFVDVRRAAKVAPHLMLILRNSPP